MDSAPRGDSDADSGAGPVDALLSALQRHDAALAETLLAPDVRLSVPPLRIVIGGRDGVARALLDVAFAFDGIGYHLRGRYLTPGGVTDETVLSGTHVRDLLGAPPTNRTSTVPARLIAGHDGTFVTRLDLWPDVAAVRAICDETARHIDQQVQGSASEMVTALRASMPVGGPRVMHGTTRDEAMAAAAAAGAAAGSALGTGVTGNAFTSTGPAGPAGGTANGVNGAAGGDVLAERSPGRTDGTKLPVPRPVRRRRALAAGGVMLAASAGLIAWIANGALNSPGGDSVLTFNGPTAGPTSAPASPTPSESPAASPTDSPTLSPTPSPSGSTEPFVLKNDQFDVQTDFLFETGSAKLAPDAPATLQLIISKIKEDRRYGAIVVNGYTDNVGSASFNLRLSRQRADAVKAVLIKGLPGWQIVSHGYGMADPRGDNSTDEGKRLNRRVSIKVPAANQPSPPPLPSTSPSRSTAAASSTPKPRPTTPKPTPSESTAGPSIAAASSSALG